MILRRRGAGRPLTKQSRMHVRLLRRSTRRCQLRNLTSSGGLNKPRRPHINVINTSDALFDRYVFFRDKFRSLIEEAERRKDERHIIKSTLPDGTEVTSGSSPAYLLRREAKWNAQAAIEAFFGWTEHSFIHLAILQGRLRTGDEVATLAAADWKAKFKAALNLTHPDTKNHYDRPLDLRAQIRISWHMEPLAREARRSAFIQVPGLYRCYLPRASDIGTPLPGSRPLTRVLPSQTLRRSSNTYGLALVLRPRFTSSASYRRSLRTCWTAPMHEPCNRNKT